MILDKKGRLFGKVSIIDVFIVIVLIVGIFVVWSKFYKKDTGKPFVAKSDKIRVVLYQEELPKFAADAIKVGDSATEKLLNSYFGKVTDVKKDKSISWVKTKDGRHVKSSKDDFSSIYVTIEGTGIYGNNGVKIGNGEYFIGQSVTMLVGSTAIYVNISDIEKI